MSESNQAKLKMGTLFGFGELERVLLSWVQKYIPPLAAGGKLHFIEREYEPAAGILVLPAFGHTPGHMAVLVFCAVRETNLPVAGSMRAKVDLNEVVSDALRMRESLQAAALQLSLETITKLDSIADRRLT